MPRRRRAGPRSLLLECFQAALLAVDGRRCVSRQLGRERLDGDWYVVAIGKAATAMTAGAVDGLGARLRGALVVTGRAAEAPGQLEDDRVRVVRSAHPVPDSHSLEAGEAVREYIVSLSPEAQLLWLISGGASSMVEIPVRGVGLAELQQVNRWLLGSGLDIVAVNAVRRRMSRLKGGGLAALAAPRRGIALMISDVPGDNPALIGSGLLHPSRRRRALPRALPAELARILAQCPDHRLGAAVAPPCRIIASNRHARAAAGRSARLAGHAVRAGRGSYAGDAAELGRRFARRIAAVPLGTVCVWGGESTVALPARPGRGGRNQHLALAAALGIAGTDGITLLAGGTDGIDGASDDAGAVVDGATCTRGAEAGLDAREHLLRADSGSFLEECGELLHTGPTGTNVGDLVIGLKSGQR